MRLKIKLRTDFSVPKKGVFMKKLVVSFLAASLAFFGFSGCSNDSDDNSALLLAVASSKNNSVQADFTQADCYGYYWGTWTVMGSAYPMCVSAAADSFRWVAQGYGDTTYPAQYTVWVENDDGSFTVKGYAASSTKTADERLAEDDPAATVTFTRTDGAVKGAFNVPSMKLKMNVEDAEIIPGIQYDSRYNGAAGAIAKDYEGTWTGTISFGSGIEATAGTTKLSVVRVSDDTAKIVIPAFTGDMNGTSMTVPGFELEVSVTAVTSGHAKTYTVALPNDASTYTVDITVDGATKTFNGSAFSFTLGSTVTMETTYTYGTMPFPFVVSFTNATN